MQSYSIKHCKSGFFVTLIMSILFVLLYPNQYFIFATEEGYILWAVAFLVIHRNYVEYPGSVKENYFFGVLLFTFKCQEAT